MTTIRVCYINRNLAEQIQASQATKNLVRRSASVSLTREGKQAQQLGVIGKPGRSQVTGERIPALRTSLRA